MKTHRETIREMNTQALIQQYTMRLAKGEPTSRNEYTKLLTEAEELRRRGCGVRERAETPHYTVEHLQRKFSPRVSSLPPLSHKQAVEN